MAIPAYCQEAMLQKGAFSVRQMLTGPCSKNDSGYIGKLEISKIKKPSYFVRLIPRYIQENLPNGF